MQKANYSYLTNATVSGFAHVYPHDNETALVNAVAYYGPIGNLLILHLSVTLFS